MGAYKTCRVEKIIAKVYRDYKPANSGWVDDAVEWVGEAIGIMGVVKNYTKQIKKINIIDRRGKLPCNVENIYGFEHKGFKLNLTGGINFGRTCPELINLGCGNETFSLNPNYITTSFKEGCINCYFDGLEVDCNGFPYVIDDVVYINACTWYILRQMCLRGFKHPVVTFEMANAQWEKTYPQAQNRFRLSSIDEMEQFKQMWVGAVRFDSASNFFNSYTTINSNANPPGTLITSATTIENNLNNTD